SAQASVAPLQDFLAQSEALSKTLARHSRESGNPASSEAQQNLDDALATFTTDVATYEAATHEHAGQAIAEDADNAALHQTTERLAPLAESSRDLLKAADHLHRLAGQVIDTLGGAG